MIHIIHVLHIVYEDGYWSVWMDGDLATRCHTREEAKDYMASL